MNTNKQTLNKSKMINELINFSCFYNVDRIELQKLSYHKIKEYYKLFKYQNKALEGIN